MLNLNVSSASRNPQDAVEGSSDEDSDGESSTKKKRAPRRGRRKATKETSEGGAEENQIISEKESPEEKKVKRRGHKKAATTASSEEEKDQAKEPKKRGRRKVKTVEESSGDGEDQKKDLTPSYQKEDDTEKRVLANVLESKIESALLEEIGEVDSLMPLVCCFGPSKYSFIPSGRPANRLIDHEIHDRMKDMFWSPDKFVRAPGGPSWRAPFDLFLGSVKSGQHITLFWVASGSA